MIANSSKPNKKFKFGRWILILIILIFLFRGIGGGFKVNETVTIKQGDTFSKFLKSLDGRDKFKIKRYIKYHGIDFNMLKQGSYTFSGSYSPDRFVNQIADGPTQTFVSYTVLEGWSIYDIDANLTKKGYIKQGEYIKFVSDPTIIGRYSKRYDFLANLNISNLEGFLYPDTYHIDSSSSFLDQLVYLQLESFKNRVWTKFSAEFTNFASRLTNNGIKLSIPMNTFNIITLASVVEKEERNSKNKPTVAGIFLKRLSIGMRLDADITLCYGLHQGYETCTPSMIVKNIYDETNPYNTRKQAGLTPTPIANPSASSIKSVLSFEPSAYIFYLHDNNGQIHYATTVSEHNQNKQTYLR